MSKQRKPNGINKAIAREEAKERHAKHEFRGSAHHAMKMADVLMQRASNGVDVSYLKTVLYPELYNADVPQPLSTQSYTRFSDKKEISVSSGGEGIFLWFPKTAVGPQLFHRTGDSSTSTPVAFAPPTVTWNGAVPTLAGGWKFGGWQDYSEYFTQANLVSASIQIQYVGQLQNEQGYFVGSHQFGTSPSLITDEDVENGQFRCFEKPGDGIRIIYIPKDMNDFTYYNIVPSSATQYNARNSGSRPTTLSTNFINTTSDVSLASCMEGGFTSQTRAWMTGEGKATGTVAKANINYALDADYIAIIYKGLMKSADATSKDLRIDVTRKFNGFPLSKHRDVLDLQKPRKIFDPKKTIDVIQELQDAIPQLVSHSLKNMDKVSDEIQEFIPNVGTLYNEGMLKEGTSLSGFAEQLQGVNGMAGNVIVPGRLYD